MIKHKLPKDWIAVNSKSYPDRVYYFNVKTNQSSWTQPTLDDADKTSQANKRKIDEGEEHHDATTSKHNLAEDKTICQQRSYGKTVETPQMNAVREKVLQRLAARNKSSLLSEASYSKLSENKRIISSSRSLSTKLSDERLRSVRSRDKNDNEITFTPQMRILNEKIQQRNSYPSNSSRIPKRDAKNNKQNENITYQKITKTWKKQEINTGQSDNETLNKHNIEQHHNNQNISREREEKSYLKKNLAKDRMQRIRKSLDLDKEKFKEFYQINSIIRKTPQKSSRSFPNSSNNSLGSTYVYRNVEIRLKRLHNRILKDTVYGKNVTLNSDKSQSQQNNEPIIENMTKDKLIQQAKQEILYEEMDWEPMKDEEIALEVEVVRTQLSRENHMDERNCISENTAELTQSNKMESHEKDPLYIVIDTNVFLSNLEIIEEARDTMFKNYPRPFIVIPWTVICELDYFKDNKSKCELWEKARKAISFIHDQFSSKHPRVIGQTREQAVKNKEDFSLNCPDDEILQCCLQIRQLRKSVVLLSYDKNLCTKAMVYNILALGRHDPLEKIDYFNMDDTVVNHLNNGPVENSIFNEELHLSDDIFEDTKMIMKNFLSTIIMKQMAEIYGEEEWKIYVIIKPPWTIVTALKCAVKHWIAAINESFQRCAEYTLKKLLDTFVHVPVGGRKLQDVEYILEKCSDLVQMINTDKHSDLMTQTFNAIMELKKKCTKYIADIDLKKLHDKIGIAENVQEQEARAEKVFQCFQYIYNYARDICGLACSNAGMAHSFIFKSIDSPLSQASIQRLQSENTRKVTDLTQNLNRLLVQAENSIKYQTLLSLQQNLNTFMPDTERTTFDVAPLDIYYCVKLKEEALKTGLRQLQELISHFCALATHT